MRTGLRMHFAALVAVLVQRYRLGAVFLGLAMAAKLYPIVLVPLAAVYVWRRAGRAGLTVKGRLLANEVATHLVPPR